MWRRNDAPVKRIADTYRVERALGSGTFGDVMKARLQRDPRRVVALKQLRSTGSDGIPIDRLRETVFFKFVRRHPNIIALYEMFRDSDSDTVVYALEYMDGTLLNFLDQHRKAKPGPLDRFKVGSIMKDMLKGLEHIHASGFVHRDLKPENILFSADKHGRVVVKLADFGLSRPLEDVRTATTRWTPYVATRWYRAPEQLLGLTFHTEALDIWAVSLILYEMCNQSPMFPGRGSFEMIALQIHALGWPGPDSMAGACPAITHRLMAMEEWKEAHETRAPQRWVSFIRWSEHAMFLAPLIRGIQWEPAARPSASEYLFEIRRILQEEHKRYGRSRLTRPIHIGRRRTPMFPNTLPNLARRPPTA